MKSFIFAFLFLLLLTSPVFAAHRIQNQSDGSILYHCLGEAGHMVTVKMKAKNHFFVLTQKTGGGGFSGLIQASNADEAAQKGCTRK